MPRTICTGRYELGCGYIYKQPNHEVYKKWLGMTNTEESGSDIQVEPPHPYPNPIPQPMARGKFGCKLCNNLSMSLTICVFISFQGYLKISAYVLGAGEDAPAHQV